MISPKFLLAALLLPATARAADDPPNPKWTRNLPDGITVELLGIGDPVTQEWWTPDGKALPEPIIDTFPMDIADPPQQTRVFVVRVQGNLNPTIKWEFDQDTGGTSGSTLKNKEQLGGVHRAVMHLPKGLKSKTLRLKVAATPWVTKANYPYLGPWSIKPTDHVVVFTRPRATEKGTSIVVVEDYIGFDTQLQALNRAGRGCGSTGGINEQKAFRIHEIEFFMPEKESIDRYELQVRPIEAVEFKDVPLVAPKP